MIKTKDFSAVCGNADISNDINKFLEENDGKIKLIDVKFSIVTNYSQVFKYALLIYEEIEENIN